MILFLSVAKLQVVEKADDGREDEVYKIEVPANRYDLLCVEGLSRALRVFKEMQVVMLK